MDLTQTQSLLDHLDISGSTLELAEPPKKLAVLGLPWDTSEETLRAYFAQFGPLEIAEIMKDRYTGKSRGFGFVTFCDSGCAQRALAAEHTIDGRRCEAKVALPKGEPTPPRTTRIFVARIPPTVTESQFRSYFEAYGKLQDAYMPKDHSKQGYRGIGFVTFASPESVEKIMAAKHWMNGQEVAIDRATPKDEPTALKNIFTRVLVPSSQRRSFDNGAGIVGTGLNSITLSAMQSQLSQLGPGAAAAAAAAAMAAAAAAAASLDQQQQQQNGATLGTPLNSFAHGRLPAHMNSYGQLRSLSEDRQDSASPGLHGAMASALTSLAGNGHSHIASAPASGSSVGSAANGVGSAGSLSHQALCAQQALGLNLGLGLQPSSAAAAAAAAAATSSALQTLARVQQQQQLQGYASSQASAAADHSSSTQVLDSSNTNPSGYGSPRERNLVAASSAAAEDAASAAQHLNSLAAAAAAAAASNGQGSLSSADHFSASLLSSALSTAAAAAGLGGLRGGATNHLGPMAASSAALSDALMHGTAHGSTAAAMQHIMAAAAVAHNSRRSLDSAAAALKRMEGPSIASARAGPRLFIGKLTKDTSEADVKEYFMRFGYVMDVYMPKPKDNKQEHRGFGFVTFETEAAIQRVVSHGSHKLKGSTIAIDIAMPKVEEEVLEGMDGAAAAAAAQAYLSSGAAAGPSSSGSLPAAAPCAAAAAAAAAAHAVGLAPIKPHLQHLAASTSVGTSLETNLHHITVTLATPDAVWEVYLDPKWARERLRLSGAQDRALFKKLEEDMEELFMKRHGRAKQLIVFSWHTWH
ncbi:hypothetical protein QJQ45_012247 [Haematococcus lacustris]|nr:hypothetical protein QJQ45_012247 [Haematococcus lacustris]